MPSNVSGESRQRAAALAITQHSRNEHFKPGTLPPEDNAGVDVTHLMGFAGRRIHHQCAWIVGEASADAQCCGKPVKPGTEWCPDHWARVYSRRAA